jgi:hypothetical protein
MPYGAPPPGFYGPPPPMGVYPPGPPMPYGAPVFVPHSHMPPPMVMHHPHHIQFTLPNVDTSVTIAEVYAKGLTSKTVDKGGNTWQGGRNGSYKDPTAPKQDQQEIPPPHVCLVLYFFTIIDVWRIPATTIYPRSL